MNAPDRSVWLAERRKGIGGSDIAAMLGLSQYKTPLQLWLDKTGRLEETADTEAEERMHWGTVLEDVVARHYASLHDVKIQRINSALIHPECPIARANIDRAVVIPGSVARVDKDGGTLLGASRILEVKTAHAMAQKSAEWGDPGSEDVPQPYWLQVQWYLGITGQEVADLAVLFGGQRYAEYQIPADQSIFSDLLTEAENWWQRHVVADIPPEASTEDEAKRLWRSHIAGKAQIVPVDVARAVNELAAVKDQINGLKKQEQELKDQITCAFQDAEAITYQGQTLATWKANKDGQKTDWEKAFNDMRGFIDQLANSKNCPDENAQFAFRELLTYFPKFINSNTNTTPGARVLRLK